MSIKEISYQVIKRTLKNIRADTVSSQYTLGQREQERNLREGSCLQGLQTSM